MIAYRTNPRQLFPPRPSEDKSVPVERRLYLWLFALCKAGEKAPKNNDIAERFGFASSSTAARHIQFLESTGLIEVERFHTSRRIFVRELQQWTA